MKPQLKSFTFIFYIDYMVLAFHSSSKDVIALKVYPDHIDVIAREILCMTPLLHSKENSRALTFIKHAKHYLNQNTLVGIYRSIVEPHKNIAALFGEAALQQR